MPPTSSSFAGAAVDVGSNSVHLLVARLGPIPSAGSAVELTPIEDRSDLIGLGDYINDERIDAAAFPMVMDSIRAMVQLARSNAATDIVLMGTDPLRRAANGPELAAAAYAELGLQMHILSERQEAELTFVGVTGGGLPGEAMAVIDIGGGSTEVSVHLPGQPLRVVPLGIGSAALTSAIVRGDPPSGKEMEGLVSAARAALARAPWPALDHPVRRAVFVGGTATNIVRLGRLERLHLVGDLAELARLPASEVVERFGVRPRRARQLAAGVAIVLAVLEKLDLPHAEVSEASLRDGAIIARATRGDGWLAPLDNG